MAAVKNKKENDQLIHKCKMLRPLKGEGGRAPGGEVMVRRALIHNLDTSIKPKGRLQKWLHKMLFTLLI